MRFFVLIDYLSSLKSLAHLNRNAHKVSMQYTHDPVSLCRPYIVSKIFPSEPALTYAADAADRSSVADRPIRIDS